MGIDVILKSKLFRAASIYAVTNILNAAIPFLILPILTRYLSPSDYGLTATYQILVSFISPFVGLSIHGAIARKYYDLDLSNLAKYIFNCFIILIISSFCVLFVLWVFADSLAAIVVFPREWLWTSIIVAVSQFVLQIVLTIWQMQSKPVQYGIFQLSYTVINVSITICLIVIMGFKWEGRVYAQLISGMLVTFAGLVILWKNDLLKIAFDFEDIQSAVRFGVPLVPHAIGGWVIVAIDRVFINRMIGISATGIYTVAVQIAMIIGLIEVSFNNAWVPWLFENLRKKDDNLNMKIVKYTYLYIVVIFFLSMGLALTTPWILLIFVGKDFRSASTYIYWLVGARAVEAIYYMTCNYLFFSLKTTYIAMASFLTSVLHIAVIYLLLKVNGAVGAAQAMFISSVVLSLLVWSFSARVHKMPWSLGRSR